MVGCMFASQKRRERARQRGCMQYKYIAAILQCKPDHRVLVKDPTHIPKDESLSISAQYNRYILRTE